MAAVNVLNLLFGQRHLVPGTDHSPLYLKHLLHLSRLLSGAVLYRNTALTEILTKNKTIMHFFVF